MIMRLYRLLIITLVLLGCFELTLSSQTNNYKYYAGVATGVSTGFFELNTPGATGKIYAGRVFSLKEREWAITPEIGWSKMTGSSVWRMASILVGRIPRGLGARYYYCMDMSLGVSKTVSGVRLGLAPAMMYIYDTKIDSAADDSSEDYECQAEEDRQKMFFSGVKLDIVRLTNRRCLFGFELPFYFSQSNVLVIPQIKLIYGF